MCLIHTNLKLTNLFRGQSIEVKALVYTGAIFLCVTEAVVLGNESLLGVIPLEAMDLIVDPCRQKLVVNPEHPNCSVAFAKAGSWL